MDNPVTFANIGIQTVSMEGAGVKYFPLYSDFNPNFLNPVVISLDLDTNYGSYEESFNPSIVFFENHFYYLTEKLNCKLSLENNIYKIDCPKLKIKVWSKTKEEVINAFNFSFHSLYNNFASVSEKKLSSGAKKLRNKLRTIVA